MDTQRRATERGSGIECRFLMALFLLTFSISDCDAFRLLGHHVNDVYPHSSDRRIRTASPQSSFSLMQKRNFVTSTSLLRSWGGDTSWLGPGRSLLSTVSFRRRVVLEMGKGDGKKKRKKKSTTASASPDPPAPAQPAAPRVSSNSNIPVRDQIRWGQINKEYAKRAAPGFRQKKQQRTKYRRAWDEEEIEEKAVERRRRGQDPDWAVILNRTASSPLVIVDGCVFPNFND